MTLMVTVNPSLQRFPMGQDRESGYHGSCNILAV